MADIKQAAKWLKEGRRVRRSWWGPAAWLSWSEGDLFVRSSTRIAEPTAIEDLLADDWELAD